MAIYLMLEFKDDNDAHTFVKDVLEHGAVTASSAVVEEDRVLTTLIVPTTVRAVWKKPTIFCTCESFERKMGFTRGRKYGWWVHSKCSKPSKLWAAGNHWCSEFGMNLLPQSEIAPEYRPPHFESPEPWKSLELLCNPSGEWAFKNDHYQTTVEMSRKEEHA